MNTQDLLGGFWGDYDNDGEGRFTSVTGVPPASRAAVSVQGVWADFNRDGVLDLFVVNSAPDLNGTAIGNFLFLGDGRGGFTPSTNGALFSLKRPCNSAATADVDGDGDLDLAVTAFGGGGNVFIVENLPGTELEHFPVGSFGSWVGGCSFADYDNDGDLDLFVGYEFRPAMLFRNDGAGNFAEATDAGLSSSAVGSLTGAWGDYDNDGWIDLLVTGYRSCGFDGTTPLNENGNDFLYHNNGDGTFSLVKTGSIVNDGVPSFTAAWGDYDNDGFLDLVVGRCATTFWSRGSSGVKSALFHNNGNQNSWLTLKLVGTKSNRDAIGAKVFVKAILQGKPVRQLREISAGHGWASQDDIRAHFGLGDATQANEVRIEWPSGQITELKNVAAKQILTITEPGGAPRLQAEITNGVLRLTLAGDSGKSYAIEVTKDLRSWKSLTTITNTAEPATLTDPDAANFSSRFYRAVAR